LAFLGFALPLLGWIWGSLSLQKLKVLDRNSPAVRAIRGKAWTAIILSSLAALVWPVLLGELGSSSASPGSSATAGAGSYQYSSVYESNFLSSCEAKGASVAACTCALRYVEANYPYSDALSFESNGIPQSVTDGVSSNCSGL
jgi:hypothetical protein